MRKHRKVPVGFSSLGMVSVILSLAILISSGVTLHARIGATIEECVARYGKPVRDSMQESGLLYFRDASLCHIVHFQNGRCDVLSVFSIKSDNGFALGLTDDQIIGILKDDGRGRDWDPVNRFTINRIWNSSDREIFAIYDTMRHKLVIMTRGAYKREKSNKPPGRNIQTRNAPA